MILRFLLYALGIYIIYKFIFELVIPVFRTTQKIRKQFGEMQDQMNAANRHASGTDGAPAPEKKKSVKAGDYIDFEEVD